MSIVVFFMMNSFSEEKGIGLNWLVSLRWWTAATQCLACILAFQFFELNIPIIPIAVLVSVLIQSNAFLFIFKDKLASHQNTTIGIVLLFDVLLLTALLYFAGGPSNPFSILFLVHVALSSVLLPRIWTWSLATLSIGLFAFIFKYHVALKGLEHSDHNSYSFHLYGMWLAYIVATVFVSYFLSKVATLLRNKERAIKDLELKQLQNERLISLASLSTGTAHELSTPLSTIALVAKDLEKSLSDNEDAKHDAKLIRSEVDRCRRIIEELAHSIGDTQQEHLKLASKGDFAKSLLEKLSKDRYSRLEILWKSNTQKICVPYFGLLQCLTSLINNSFEASDPHQGVSLVIQDNNCFEVIDSGCGMDESAYARAKDPFFSTKTSGLGLGLYIVEIFTNNWGGTLEISSNQGIGTKVTMSLPKLKPLLQKDAA